MAIPAGVARVSVVGHLRGGEIFDTSFWCLGGVTPSDGQDLADGVKAALLANPLPFLGMMNASGGVDEIRVYSYPSGGPAAATVHSAAVNAVGTSTGATQASQSCLVATLLTGLLGRRNRGRMYLPAVNVQLDGTTGLLTTPTAAAVSAAMGTFFTDVNNIALGGGGNPVVSVVSQTASNVEQVTQVGVDNRIDIQRRRANQQAHGPKVISAVT